MPEFLKEHDFGCAAQKADTKACTFQNMSLFIDSLVLTHPSSLTPLSPLTPPSLLSPLVLRSR